MVHFRDAPWLRKHFYQFFTNPLNRTLRTSELAGLGPVAEMDADLFEWGYAGFEGRKVV